MSPAGDRIAAEDRARPWRPRSPARRPGGTGAAAPAFLPAAASGPSARRGARLACVRVGRRPGRPWGPRARSPEHRPGPARRESGLRRAGWEAEAERGAAFRTLPGRARVSSALRTQSRPTRPDRRWDSGFPRRRHAEAWVPRYPWLAIWAGFIFEGAQGSRVFGGKQGQRRALDREPFSYCMPRIRLILQPGQALPV